MAIEKEINSLAKIANIQDPFYKISGMGKFLEFSASTIGSCDGKIKVLFSAYDAKRAKGSKMTAQIDVYVAYEELLTLCHKIKTGQLQELYYKHIVNKARETYSEMVKKNVAKEELDRVVAVIKTENLEKIKALITEFNEKYKITESATRPKFASFNGGVPADRLKKQGRARKDGKPIAKVFAIELNSPKMRYPYVIKSSVHPGASDKNGLIRIDGPAEQQVSLNMDDATLLKMAMAIEANIQAYLSAQYTANCILATIAPLSALIQKNFGELINSNHTAVVQETETEAGDGYAEGDYAGDGYIDHLQGEEEDFTDPHPEPVAEKPVEVAKPVQQPAKQAPVQQPVKQAPPVKNEALIEEDDLPF